jgi:hypothetical protein
MKKFTTIFAMLLLTLGLSAQGVFTPIGWNAVPADVDWSADPYAKQTVVIPMANANMNGNVDIAAMTAGEVKNIWERIGDANYVAYQTDADLTDPYDLDASGEGTFGASWKAFHDDNAIYLILKYVDTDEIATARWYEIALQTKENVRYEAGFTAATTITEKNNQYARYVELGGMKLVLKGGVVTDNSANLGQTGGWAGGGALGGTNVGTVSEILEADNTLWTLYEIPYSDLQYFDDEWGANEAANLLDWDYDTKNVISFDVSGRATIDQGAGAFEYKSWWNANVDICYTYVFYAGLMELGTDVFDPLAVNVANVSEKNAYIYNGMLRLSGFDSNVDLDIYSIIGQKVMSAKNVASELSVSSLNDGVYIVKVNGEMQAFKVLK